ncbi:MAG: C39 family peptidase, partial [Planctomycetota bacterium]
TEARILIGRLAPQVGAMRTGMSLHLRAFRADPTDAVAAYYASQTIFTRKGPWETLRFLDAFEVPEDCHHVTRSDLLTARATAAASLRDFATADRLLDEAEDLAPGSPWVSVERSWVHELQDRYEEALDAAREALDRKPLYRPGLQALGRALVFLGRDREALEVLSDAAPRIESGPLVRQLVDLQIEKGLFEEAKENLEVLTALWVEPDKVSREILAGLKSDVAYLLDDAETCVQQARQVKQPFYERLVENLTAASPDAKRILLEVPFIRQHHMTCGAATIAGLADFWDRPADHESVARDIVYDGSRPADERKWCEDHGWVVREFTLTWDSAVALIDRGVPFALTTAEPATSHLQSVVGYDARRGSLLVRDPSNPSRTEFLAKEACEHYAPVGPRAMAIVPEDRFELISDLDLPDAKFYDDYHELQRALIDDDRGSAGAAADRMRESDTSHRLTIEADLSLAYYDRSGPTSLKLIDRLLEKFPDSDYWE